MWPSCKQLASARKGPTVTPEGGAPDSFRTSDLVTKKRHKINCQPTLQNTKTGEVGEESR